MPTMIDLDRIQQILTTLDENINGYLMLRYLKKGTVHQLYGPHDPTRDMELAVFTATDNFSAGDTFTIDGVAYSASSENGKALTSSQFVTGASVQIVINNKLNHITFKSGSGVGGVDSSQLSQTTATAGDVLSGKTFYAGNNSLKTGTRSSGTLQKVSGYFSKLDAYSDTNNSYSTTLAIIPEMITVHSSASCCFWDNGTFYAGSCADYLDSRAEDTFQGLNGSRYADELKVSGRTVTFKELKYGVGTLGGTYTLRLFGESTNYFTAFGV